MARQCIFDSKPDIESFMYGLLWGPISIFHNLCLWIELILQFCGSISITPFCHTHPPLTCCLPFSCFKCPLLCALQLFLHVISSYWCGFLITHIYVYRNTLYSKGGALFWTSCVNQTFRWFPPNPLHLWFFIPASATRYCPPRSVFILVSFVFIWAVRSAMTSIVLEIIMDIVCELYLYYVAYIYMLINTSSVSYMRLSLACCIYFASWKPPTFFVSLWRRLYRCLALMQWDLNISHVLYHSALFPKSL